MLYDFKNPSFDIDTLQPHGNIDEFTNLSMYLDFAISSTIKKQMPNINIEIEKETAKKLLNNHMMGVKSSFTSTYGIRNNIETIGYDKIKNILIKSMIEKHAFNLEVKHQLQDNSYIDQCAHYVSDEIMKGNYNEIQDWINQNLPFFVENYIDTKYLESLETKQQYDSLPYRDPNTERAIEQLNLEMKLNNIKQI